MFRARIDTSDLERKLNEVTGPDLIRDIAEKVAKEAVQPELAKEPFRTTHKKMQFVSAKQRVFVIIAIKRGDIQVPYRRTGQVGITEVHQTTTGADVVAPSDHSDVVRTRGKQARYHQPLWPDDVDIAAKLEADVVEVIGTAAVVEALEKAGLT